MGPHPLPTGRSPGPRDVPVQLALPFLTPDEAGTIHAVREVVARSEAAAITRRHPAEAAELARLGDELVAILERNAEAARACNRGG